jgi:peptidoglycan hydrolase-like protein with peptidoglycan-binding domain
MGGDPPLLDPNVPADAETIQNRLRSLGFPVNDPRDVWSKGTDRALNRFRKSHGLRTDGRWGLSTQAALFGQNK